VGLMHRLEAMLSGAPIDIDLDSSRFRHFEKSQTL
jgi:hypothetical protein